MEITKPFSLFSSFFSRFPFKKVATSTSDTPKQPGFGTFYGVYLPGVLTMFGVIIYLRMGWIVGACGLYTTLAIVSLSCLIVFITALSISATATNMKILGGGAYFIISRVFGLQVGSSIAVPLYFATSMSIAFCITGFAESVHALWPQYDVKIIGVISLCVCALLAYTSAKAALKAQFVIFIIMAASLVSLFCGNTPQPLELQTPVLEPEISFWRAFALFFPACTGVEAGVAMSGDLRNPGKSLPLGAISVVVTGYLVYTLIPLFLSAVVPRENLLSDPMVVQHTAKWGSLIILGIWVATLSSALGGILAAPRSLQALARDGIVSRWIGKGFGPTNEPRVATLITFFISLTVIWFGSINIIAPVLTMFCLISYGTLNMAAGLEGLMDNPSWRPRFYIPWYISLLGSLLCFIAMLMISAGATLIAIALVLLMYMIIKRRDLAADWDDIRQGILLFFCRKAVYSLTGRKQSVRSWRPNFLVFTDTPYERSNLLVFTTAITRNKGFLTMASLFPENSEGYEYAKTIERQAVAFFENKHIQAIVKVATSSNVIQGIKTLITGYGLGPLSPNTIVLGETFRKKQFKHYAEIIKLCSSQSKNVVILREDLISDELFDTKNYEEKVTFGPDDAEGTIDIWWDDAHPNNADLMIVLAHMLQRSPLWHNKEIVLKCLVATPEERQERLSFFHQFFQQSRLNVFPKVFISHGIKLSLAQTIRLYSQRASLVMVGLRHPHLSESLDEYSLYYQELSELHATKEFAPVAFVLGADHIELKELFK